MDKNNKLALVRIDATDEAPETLLVELAFGDKQLTIADRPADQVKPMSAKVHHLAQQLIEQILSEE